MLNMTQKNWVENHLINSGKITRNLCLRNYVSRLGAIISMLKDDGYEFDTEYIEVKTPFGKGKDYQYTVTKAPAGVVIHKAKVPAIHKPVETKIEYAYSLNGEDFIGFDEMSDILEDDGSIRSIYKGEQVKKYHSDFIGAIDVIDNIVDSVSDEHPDYSDGYIDSLESDKKHIENINKLVLNYLNENVEQPNFYAIKNIKQIDVLEFL